MTNHKEQLNAGPFSSWLEQIRISLHRGESVEVPCGICAACCTSGFYIAIGKQETASLDKIPEECLFEIPGSGEALYIGCDDQGHCLLLDDGRCTIYDHRPLACRTFDCRIYAATDIVPDKDKDSPIVKRINNWEFEYPTERDRYDLFLLRAATAILSSLKTALADDHHEESSRIAAMKAIKFVDSIKIGLKSYNDRELLTAKEN